VVGERVDTPSWLRPHLVALVTEPIGRERVRLVTERAYLDGRWVGTVVAGVSLTGQDQLLERVRLLLWLGGLAGLLLSLTAGWLLAGRAVAPIRRAYEARSHFVADASHELRTPLTYVRSAIEMVAERVPDVGADLLDEVDYLTRLTDRLLALARSDGNSLDLALGPVPVLGACRQAAARNERALGLTVSVASGQAPDTATIREPVALADRVGLQAALDATLENAFRHGGGAAEVRTSERGDRVLIQVADHGPGLSPSERSKVFERFYRVDTARSRQAGGAGLGLPLARSLVEAQKGRMWLEDTPGGGLTACIELTTAPDQSAASSLSRSTRPPERQYTPRSRERNPSSTR
jgi:signal transduction histidine kinase